MTRSTALGSGAESPLATVTELDVPIPMRDGTLLRGHVMRPAGGSPAPVLLMRTPYPLEGARFDTDTLAIARRGLAFVLVSARGTGRSEGDFRPWRDERSDGADTIAWCAAQPWSTGKVATVGRSYRAQTQLYAAGEAPAALKAMAVGVVPSHPYEMVYDHGALQLGSLLQWSLMMAGNELARRADRGEDVTADTAEWRRIMEDLPAIYQQTPLSDIPVLEKYFPSWGQWLERPGRDGYWDEVAIPPRPELPAFFVAGWHDLFLPGTLREWARKPRHADSRLVIGPWAHGIPGQALGDVDYGYAASGPAFGLDNKMLDFLEAQLRDGTTAEPELPVDLFVTGINRWRREGSWPPDHCRDRDLYLHEGGTLSTAPPASSSPPTEFRFDPHDPVPTVGGATLMAPAEAARLCGSVEQSILDGRTDIARFSTGPLARDAEVIGAVRLTLHAATTAADTDWTAKLLDCTPAGAALNIADGVVRARFCTPGGQRLPQGEPHEFEIEIGSIAHVFKAGHRIRLDISSSNFPLYDRNPGSGDIAATAAEEAFTIAEQSIHHDPARPSRLTLPMSGGAELQT